LARLSKLTLVGLRRWLRWTLPRTRLPLGKVVWRKEVATPRSSALQELSDMGRAHVADGRDLSLALVVQTVRSWDL
jgi:hypothetical protein